MTEPVTVLISSRNRPLYLWACLDALYSFTRYPHRFVLLDLASDDPMVENVIRGFERRRMFHEIVRAEQNHPSAVLDVLRQNFSRWTPWFAYVESDALVHDTWPCWLTRLVSIMEKRPRMAMLGSAIDHRDFVDPEKVAHLRGDADEAHWRSLLKADSIERGQDLLSARGEEVFHPHNPAGRLLLLRTEALQKMGLATDGALDAMMRSAGYETGIATRVRHRHLSLLHVYDYADYDIDGRNQYMSAPA
ncbi:MAG: glycosyltransferase family A protein [Pseudomonadota bacterium]